MLIRSVQYFSWLSISILLVSCEPFDRSCVCEPYLEMNVCVSGKYNRIEGSAFFRERDDGIIDTLKTLPSAEGDSRSCAAETGNRQRIVVYQNQVRVDSSGWFKQAVKDCCHFTDTTITF